MLCRALMSPYTLSTTQVLWSEPTHLTLGENRIEAAVCFSVITDRIPELSHPRNKGYFCSLALSLPGSGADVPSAFLHADHLHSPLTPAAWAALLFQLSHGDEPEGYFTCCTGLWFSSFSSVLERYSLWQRQCVPQGCTSLQGCTLVKCT